MKFSRAEDDASGRLPVSPKIPAGGLGQASPTAGSVGHLSGIFSIGCLLPRAEHSTVFCQCRRKIINSRSPIQREDPQCCPRMWPLHDGKRMLNWVMGR
jgi:hypothetical protein